MQFTNFISGITNAAKVKITSLVNLNLSNSEKKERLDSFIKDWIEVHLDTFGFNFIIKLMIKKFIIPNIPIITQNIFDLLKAKIEGITK